MRRKQYRYSSPQFAERRKKEEAKKARFLARYEARRAGLPHEARRAGLPHRPRLRVYIQQAQEAHTFSASPNRDPNATEEWRAVVGYEGLYSISSQGRVYSLFPSFAQRGRGGRRGGLLRSSQSGRGYCRIHLSKVGLPEKIIYVHRLVLEAFVGPCPEGMQAAHGDGNPSNNQLDNLRWATSLENHADRIRHRTR